MKLHLTKLQLHRLVSCGKKKKPCNLRIYLRKKANHVFKSLTQKQLYLINQAIKLKKAYFNLQLSTEQTGGMLPFLIPALIAAGKALGLGAVGYLGSKVAQKMTGGGKKKRRGGKKHGKTRKKQRRGKGVYLPGRGKIKA